MKTTIGAYNPASKSVSVTFSEGEVRHERNVNAVLKEDGSYDRAATKDRVAQVALGVAVKIAAGAIGAPPVIEPPVEAE